MYFFLLYEIIDGEGGLYRADVDPLEPIRLELSEEEVSATLASCSLMRTIATTSTCLTCRLSSYRNLEYELSLKYYESYEGGAKEKRTTEG
ncbi:hypothetical protein F2Q70_00026612 [Brassica cretica]|uniref:Uncharacterized protein n=2 Tax=Brassica cretica TaxID=69181 RepID=A0A3N6RGA9_BRACR|nr:hypothetical protein F2Q68_00026183 [Brassica cretica]KAF2604203.1 hypothetical protein F2Q70_00026612 [Brassica cretica]KAF3579899.1 hypothetical protein DY000_02032365 [Brassica cretica]